MGLGDKIKNKAEELAGQAQEGLGKLTHNEDMERQGQATQAKAEAKQAGEAVKDKASEVGHKVQDKVNDVLNGNNDDAK